MADQAAEKAGPGTATPMFWVVLLSAGLLVLFVWLGGRPQNPLGDRIAESCARQFPETDARTRCEIALAADAIQKDEARRLSRAAHEAGD